MTVPVTSAIHAPRHGPNGLDSLSDYYVSKGAEVLNVKDHGATGDGTTSDSVKVQDTLNLAIAGQVVYFPSTVNGYNLSSSILTVPDGVTVRGNRTKVSFGGLSALFSVGSNVTIDGIAGYANAGAAGVLVKGTRISGLTVRNCYTSGPRLVDLNPSLSYSSVSSADYCTDIRIEGNRCYTTGTVSSSESAIHLQFCASVVVTNNRIDGHRHGVGWWGGDSNLDGAIANTRKCTDLRISDNHITNIYNGGIWGSMGERIAIGNNIVTDCGDVGIDVEGCNYATISGNVVKNCTNGCITTFFLNSGIDIHGNVCSTSTADQWLFGIHNSGQSTNNKDIIVHGNTFTGEGVIARVGQDNADSINIVGNSFRNVKISFISNNYHLVTITRNVVMFDIVSGVALDAILVQKTNSNGVATVSDNIIYSVSAQPAGSRGIYVYQDDFNSAPTTLIDSNRIRNFPTDMEIYSGSANAGITPVFIIRDNIFGAGVFTRTEGSTNKSAVSLEANRRPNGAPFPSAIPTSGKWDVGQVAYSTTPGTGTVGWVCVTQGTPGTWMSWTGLV